MASREVVRCRDLVCGYGGNVTVRDVNLVVNAGEVVTVIGGSGSGKSTLLKTLIGLLPPLAGSVDLLGRDLRELDRSQRRTLGRRVGMLYQEDALFGSMSVLDNVCLPLSELTDLPPNAIELAARSRLALVDVLAIERSLPSQISGGQSKRAALARATILDPELLFCDEPTSGLDPVAAAQVDALLLRFRDVLGMAVIAVTHDVIGVQSIADRAIVLGAGGIVAQGTVAELEASERPQVKAFFQRARPERAARERSMEPWQTDSRSSSSPRS